MKTITNYLTAENLSKAAAILSTAVLAMAIVRKNWLLNRTKFANLRSVVPALAALVFATMKGTK